MNEYIAATVGADTFNVGEYWVDMDWCGCELNSNQDAARQVGRHPGVQGPATHASTLKTHKAGHQSHAGSCMGRVSHSNT